MLTGKGFDSRGRVHVSDGDDLARIEKRRQLAPAGFHLADVGHIGHGATGVQVGKNNHLVLTAKNVGALGHKVYAAEDNIAAFGLRSLEGELEGVTTEIGELDDFVALVVMAQNHDILAQAGFCGSDALVKGVVRDEEVGIKVAAYTGFELGRVKSRRLVCADEGTAIRNGY